MHAADLKQEVVQYLLAVLSVIDLRVELHAVETAFLVGNRHVGAGKAVCRQGKSAGQVGHIVTMAHPRNAFLR